MLINLQKAFIFYSVELVFCLTMDGNAEKRAL